MSHIPQTRPLVTISYAQTLDGRLAARNGSSQWISCSISLEFAHNLRAQHDAIMVGAGTVCVDNPRLTVRLVPGRNPLRVVVDSTLRTPLSAAILVDGAASGTLLATTERATAERCEMLRRLGATVLVLPSDAEGHVDLQQLLAALYARGIRSVMVEGGATLITALLRARLADRLAICVAPKILGAGIEAVGDLGIGALADALVLRDLSVERCGDDLVLMSRIAYPDQKLEHDTA